MGLPQTERSGHDPTQKFKSPIVHQINECLIGVVETPCKDGRNMKERDLVLREQSVRVGDRKPRGCQR